MKTWITWMLIVMQAAVVIAQDNNDTEWYLQREDVDIYIKEMGTGKDTVIVVHGGFGANHDYMLDAVKGLENRFRFIFYDQRGSLLSPTKKENLTFQKNVDDLYALTRALKLKKVKLFCHSMGTLLGMEFVKQHPNTVTHLVLAGALLPKSDSVQSVFSARQRSQVDFLMNRKEVAQLLKDYKDKGVDNIKSIKDIKGSKLSHKDLTEYWRIHFAAVNIYDIHKHHLVKGGRAYYKQDASVMSETVNWNYDYRSLLNNQVKTTIINGTYDFLDFEGESLTRQLKEFPHIQLHLIPNAGHNAWIDNPKVFKNYLMEGLRD